VFTAHAHIETFRFELAEQIFDVDLNRRITDVVGYLVNRFLSFFTGFLFFEGLISFISRVQLHPFVLQGRFSTRSMKQTALL
jgi:hypothetical protein